MNGEAIGTLLLFAGLCYGAWILVDKSEAKYQQREDDWKALYERQVAALEAIGKVTK